MTDTKHTRRKGYAVLMQHKRDLDEGLVIWGKWFRKELRPGADGVRPYIFDSSEEAVRMFGETRNGFYLTGVVYIDLDAGCRMLDSAGEGFC